MKPRSTIRSNSRSPFRSPNNEGESPSNIPTSAFAAAAPQMVEETIHDYDSFKKRISELEAQTASLNPKPDIFAVFSGNYSPGPDGKSWCGMCNVVAEAIKKEILPRYRRKGYLLWVRVGEPEVWMKRDNPFRIDKDLKLKSIPAAIAWRSKLKLEGFPMISLMLVAELFSVEIEDPPQS